MSLGNLGWNNLLLGINGGVNNPTLFRNEENEEAKLMQSIPNGNRITDDGYMTNAPLELGDDDFVHAIEDDGKSLKVSFDSNWVDNHCSNPGSFNYEGTSRTVKSIADDIANLARGGWTNSCKNVAGNHYWMDRTQKYSVGCGLADTTNYTDSADFKDNSFCMYECLDANRIPNSDGSCSDSCSDDYEIRDGYCQLTSGEQIKTNIAENVGKAGLIIASGIALKIFFSR